ncbi:MFS transporter [Microlunatus soli]|uniref:MFS transporter, DHA1 family, purine ribonucleoside efflux pump n=1 Tax=Microlunatus soli TaxID=630515 RepID=A0A1H1RT12_9ACTN|nr:MFS transporter [Microlunatus soli]SDS38820.1 MFS transporter, DHA1 family, purine ribonucleoside efflux pump [Microlunatus soli]
MTSEPSRTDRDTGPAPSRRLTPLLALDFGITMLVAGEFLPAGVLPEMAADLGVSEGTAGLAVSATAVAGAITAPTIAALLPRMDRRRVLIGLLIAATLADLTVALAPAFWVMVIGRLILGIAIAGFWTFAFGAGTHALPGRDRLVSTSLSLGVSLATIIGVPLASIGSDALGWRTVFGIATLLTAIAAVAVIIALPAVPAHPSAGWAMMRRAIGNPRLIIGLLCIAAVAMGNFAAYPYIRLVIMNVSPSSAAWLLLVWGLGGLVGNLVAGALATRLTIAVVAAPTLLAAGLATAASANGLLQLVIGVVLWGVGFNMVPVATQLWVTRVEPERAESALGLQVTAFQLAITAGSALGGVLVDDHGVTTALSVGAVVAFASAVGFAALRSPRARA